MKSTGGRGRRNRRTINQRLNWLKDYNQKWIKRDNYYKKREDRRRNIYRR